MTNRTLQKHLFQTSTALLGLAVLLGAFGAHGLKSSATIYEQDIFRTGVLYQFIHALGLLILSIGMNKIKEKSARIVRILFITGIILFSGSLYLLGLRTTLNIGDTINWIGILTPIGGLCFISGWFYLTLYGFKQAEHDHQEG